MLRIFFDWSEVWSLLIPLTILVVKKKKYADYLKPVIAYIIITLLIFLAANIIWKHKNDWHLPQWLHSNNYLYNTHAILQFFLFGLFFIRLNQPFAILLKKLFFVVFILFALINFIFFEKFFFFNSISSHIHSVGVGLLLAYCLLYFLFLLQDDSVLVIQKQKGFWIVSALTIYVTVNFFIFLFYSTLILDEKNRHWAENIWDVHNATFLLLCICITKTFNEQPEK